MPVDAYDGMRPVLAETRTAPTFVADCPALAAECQLAHAPGCVLRFSDETGELSSGHLVYADRKPIRNLNVTDGTFVAGAALFPAARSHFERSRRHYDHFGAVRAVTKPLADPAPGFPCLFNVRARDSIERVRPHRPDHAESHV